jgi:hypothetical protein
MEYAQRRVHRDNPVPVGLAGGGLLVSAPTTPMWRIASANFAKYTGLSTSLVSERRPNKLPFPPFDRDDRCW